jgi:hypothetical protein
LLVVGAAYTVLVASHASTKSITDRIVILKNTGTTSDASFRDRESETRAARTVFYANPIFGAGPGTVFNWTVTNGDKHSGFDLDSPVDFPAKFGIAGLVVVGFLVLGYGSFLRSSFRVNHPRAETLALASYAALAVAGSVLTTPLEDKGLTLGLVLLLALALSTWDPLASAPVALGRPPGP